MPPYLPGLAVSFNWSVQSVSEWVFVFTPAMYPTYWWVGAPSAHSAPKPMYTEPLRRRRPVRCISSAALNLLLELLPGEPAICFFHLMAPVCSLSATKSYVGV